MGEDKCIVGIPINLSTWKLTMFCYFEAVIIISYWVIKHLCNNQSFYNKMYLNIMFSNKKVKRTMLYLYYLFVSFSKQKLYKRLPMCILLTNIEIFK